MNDSRPKIGLYSILECLGRGTSGIVYKAYCDEHKRFVALKVPFLHPPHENVIRARFLREARTMAACWHANIATIYSVDNEYIAGPYYAREFIDGQTLEQLVDAGKIGLSAGVRVIANVAKGLWAVHRQGVVHRNLQPANVMVDKTGVAKLIGFSKAMIIEEAGANGHENDLQALRQMLAWICDSIQHPLLTPMAAVQSDSITTASSFADALESWLQKMKGN